MESLQHPMIEVFRSQELKACQERALVLRARSIPYSTSSQSGDHVLLVPSSSAAEALREFSSYGQENVGWPPPKLIPHVLSNGVLGVTLYALLLLSSFPLGKLDQEWWDDGVLIAGPTLSGESWRAVTALTLHGDVSHLVGNLVFGCGFGLLAARALGAGLAWSCVLLSGVLGNLLNAALQHPDHRSIGASTAVFGCLGLMAGYEWLMRHRLNQKSMRRLAPILAAAVLLGFLGMGGGSSPEGNARTDVVAHVTGMLAGIVLGLLLAWGRLPERLGTKAQRLLAALSLATPVAAWFFALH